MKELTVADLKEMIKDLDDNMPIIRKSDNFELNGNYVAAKPYDIKVGDCYSPTNRTFRDAFDGITYETEVYVRDEKDGKKVLIL